MRAIGALLLAFGLAWTIPARAQPVLGEARPAAIQGLQLVAVAKGLERPWALAFLPDGGMLVTERAGRLRLVRDGALDPRPIAGVPEVHFKRNGCRYCFDGYQHG